MLGLAHRPKLDRKKKLRFSTAVVSPSGVGPAVAPF
jgi:hypothetical protein